MSDNYDPFVEAEIEERLLAKSLEIGRAKLIEAISLEIGDAALRLESKPRDLRWFRGLFTRSYASRIG